MKVLFCLAIVLAALFIADAREAPPRAPEIGDDRREIAELPGNGVIADLEGPPCSLDVQKDLPKRNASQPLYLVPGTDRVWLPNGRGFLEVPRGASIELFCSRAFANSTGVSVPRRTQLVRATCLQGRTFRWGGAKCELQQFACSAPPRFVAERTGAACAGGRATLYRVGFNVTRGRFVRTMSVCHDDDALRALYSQHRLQPANAHFQTSVKRTPFSQAGLFRGLNLNALYSQANQRRAAEALLAGLHERLFANGSLLLTRGHLAAKADLVYGALQRSSFTFLNAAPQWASFNGGQWSRLEDEVRKFVARAALDVDCYTGTWGTLALPLPGGERRPLFLGRDANNNGLLPVPQLYFRVLVDRAHPARGIALVGVNNPHASLAEIRAEYELCEDISAEVGWLGWMRNENLRKGFLYACRVPDFLRVVDTLPPTLAAVRETLGAWASSQPSRDVSYT